MLVELCIKARWTEPPMHQRFTLGVFNLSNGFNPCLF